MIFSLIVILLLVDIDICSTNAGDMQKVKGLDSLVYTGQPFHITDAPYMALYCVPKGAVCGASIIHKRFLVSAAHCVTYNTHVKVGTDKLDGGKRYNIEEQILHPKYDIITTDYDVAIIKLKKNLVLCNKVQPISLATRKTSFRAGDMMMALGFGETETGPQSKRLLKIDIPYVTRRACNKLYKPFAYITRNMICAGGVGGKDVCYGDSGGPLVYKGALVGVVSYGAGCGWYPSVYASIPALRRFIDSTLKKYNCVIIK